MSFCYLVQWLLPLPQTWRRAHVPAAGSVSFLILSADLIKANSCSCLSVKRASPLPLPVQEVEWSSCCDICLERWQAVGQGGSWWHCIFATLCSSGRTGSGAAQSRYHASHCCSITAFPQRTAGTFWRLNVILSHVCLCAGRGSWDAELVTASPSPALVSQCVPKGHEVL